MTARHYDASVDEFREVSQDDWDRREATLRSLWGIIHTEGLAQMAHYVMRLAPLDNDAVEFGIRGLLTDEERVRMKEFKERIA